MDRPTQRKLFVHQSENCRNELTNSFLNFQRKMSAPSACTPPFIPMSVRKAFLCGDKLDKSTHGGSTKRLLLSFSTSQLL
mmetsp:Transcript_55249/g.108083  ORF Transcript_55249/g.108083 Transcript_55249/m.108083 type:complete len:80 (+) Transcript_55249:301-540(+)